MMLEFNTGNVITSYRSKTSFGGHDNGNAITSHHSKTTLLETTTEAASFYIALNKRIHI
jgi:hypothetical protein